MTNAKSLAKDTRFMLCAIEMFCGDGDDCMFCRFSTTKDNGKISCIFGKRDENRATRICEWLESEAKK